MSSDKPPAAEQQPPGRSHAVPQSTSLFRAMNFELFVKPVQTPYRHLQTGPVYLYKLT